MGNICPMENASNFDETEIKAILEIALLAGGGEVVISSITRKKE